MIITLIIILLIGSCNENKNQASDKLTKTYYSNGKLKSVKEFKDKKDYWIPKAR